MCHNFKVMIQSVMWLDKRDKGYKATTHFLTCMFTGLHETYYPSWLPFHPMVLSGENEVLYGRIRSCLPITRAARLLNKACNLLKLRHQNFLINCLGVSVYHHLKIFRNLLQISDCEALLLMYIYTVVYWNWWWDWNITY